MSTLTTWLSMNPALHCTGLIRRDSFKSQVVEIFADTFPNFYRKGKLLPPAINVKSPLSFFGDFFVRDWTLLFAKNLTQKFDPKIIAENLKGLSKYKT